MVTKLNVIVQIYRANQGKLAEPNAKVSLPKEPKSVSVEQKLLVKLLSQKRVGGSLLILLMINMLFMFKIIINIHLTA